MFNISQNDYFTKYFEPKIFKFGSEPNVLKKTI